MIKYVLINLYHDNPDIHIEENCSDFVDSIGIYNNFVNYDINLNDKNLINVNALTNLVNCKIGHLHLSSSFLTFSFLFSKLISKYNQEDFIIISYNVDKIKDGRKIINDKKHKNWFFLHVH